MVPEKCRVNCTQLVSHHLKHKAYIDSSSLIITVIKLTAGLKLLLWRIVKDK